MKLYIASSWRNKNYENVLAGLRDQGHECYDFRHPSPGNHGFSWSKVAGKYKAIDAISDYLLWLQDPIAQQGFQLDKGALDWCEAGVLVLPCGRSAHSEAGYLAGQGKPVIVLLSPIDFEPELMYLLYHKCVTSITAVCRELSILEGNK